MRPKKIQVEESRWSIENRAINALHSEFFPEEYDLQYDSIVDAQERRRGKNPMNEDYQRKVNLRRFALGVEPYCGSVGIENADGLITSREYCKRQLKLGEK